MPRRSAVRIRPPLELWCTEFLNGAKKCRVFIRPSEYRRLEAAGKADWAGEEARRVLYDHFGLSPEKE
jgi:hypothetical protein